MPVYHSSIPNNNDYTRICGGAILPLKTKVKGPAPPCPDDQPDIIDEAIEYFRANILFRSFEPSGPADLVLAYLTIYIAELIRHFQRGSKTASEARKNVTQISLSQTFTMPGENGFCLGGFFTAPANRQESDSFRAYFLQLRTEAGYRLIDHIYNADETPNKFWFQFSKRKFMNIERT